MFLHPRRTLRKLRRVLRPAVVLALVLAQCVAAFGYPVVVRAGETVRRCGCKVRGPSETCCCGPQECCAGVARHEVPEPQQPTCPKCRLKESAKHPAATSGDESATVTWVAGMKARQCHGDGPFGLVAEFPAIPPVVPARPIADPVPVGVVRVCNDQLLSHTSIPPDPPPRCG